MASTSAFFAVKNVQHIFELCRRFLVDKYQVDVPEKQLRTILQDVMQELQDYFDNHPPMPPVDELNKRTIIRAKEKILLLMRDLTMPPSPPPPPAASLPKSPEEDDTQDPKDEEFFNKLQQLELQRSASIATPAPTPPKEPLLVPSAPLPPPPSGPTVLYVPTTAPLRSSQTVLIAGIDRDWQYFHDRASMVWSGPLPISESSQLSLSALWLPSGVDQHTPYVLLEIEGAGGHLLEVVCSRAQKGDTWDMWRPISDSSALLKSVACPWNLRVKDAFRELLPLGSDGMVIEEVERLASGNTQWTLSHTTHVQKGTCLVVQDNKGKRTRFTVLQVYAKRIEVAGDATRLQGSLCAVWNQQWSLVLENVKIESSK
jgi:hypothetical protein